MEWFLYIFIVLPLIIVAVVIAIWRIKREEQEREKERELQEAEAKARASYVDPRLTENLCKFYEDPDKFIAEQKKKRERQDAIRNMDKWL